MYVVYSWYTGLHVGMGFARGKIILSLPLASPHLAWDYVVSISEKRDMYSKETYWQFI